MIFLLQNHILSPDDGLNEPPSFVFDIESTGKYNRFNN